MTNETLQAYLAAAKEAKHLATKCGTHNVLSLGIAKIVCEDIPTLSDAVVALAAEVERLQNEYARGRADAVRAIRAKADEYDGLHRMTGFNLSYHEGDIATKLEMLADAIERGEHLEATDD